MGQWEPLAERIPVDMRRLATQLRRMKDRSAMTVPALAARTAHPVEGWERAFAGRQLPPLDAVEVLAQASGADYDRIGALWRLAEKAATGSGDRGRGREVPHPDPLDPLGPDEGLPRQHRRAVLVATLGLLAAASLVAVLFMAGTSTGRAPGGRADGVAGGVPAVPKGAPTTGSAGPAEAAGPTASAVRPGGRVPGGASDAPRAADGDHPSAAMGSLAPSAAPPRVGGAAPGGTDSAGGAGTDSVGGAGTGSGGAGGGTGGAGTGGGTSTAGGSAAPVTTAPPAPAPTGGAPSPSPSPVRLCLGLIVIGLCIN